MSEVDLPGEPTPASDTMLRLERAMEKYAPAGYDPASDDLTIPFAMELVEKDRKIESDAKVIAALREALEKCGKPFRVSDNNIKIPWEMLAREFNIRQAIAIEALAADEQTVPVVAGYGFDLLTGREFPCDKDGKEVKS